MHLTKTQPKGGYQVQVRSWVEALLPSDQCLSKKQEFGPGIHGKQHINVSRTPLWETNQPTNILILKLLCSRTIKQYISTQLTELCCARKLMHLASMNPSFLICKTEIWRNYTLKGSLDKSKEDRGQTPSETAGQQVRFITDTAFTECSPCRQCLSFSCQPVGVLGSPLIQHSQNALHVTYASHSRVKI